MATHDSDRSRTAWPGLKFRFEVRWDSALMAFQEATGLAAEAQRLEHGTGHSQLLPAVKMPGIRRPGTVTLTKGVVESGTAFAVWLDRVKTNTAERAPVTISLLDERGRPAMVWTLVNALPVKVTATALNATANEVAVETLELTHEGLSASSA
jgi:phage tail-like protein